ncbi:kinase-associated lipoprotein B [Bacillus sp. V3B]|uniref:kinase-associated lipoprotein B n=1 Tax=Bacillus sp. V3B TaxID=2804915 RepID=UPI00210F036E|nr:kinase-associated lipoprotein B [Bacillus sp. V3B]
MDSLQVGDTVTAIYKTGKYIGEITDIRPEHFLVRVLAVMKHPMQGDLHHPKDVDVPFFHERKALSYREQANIPKKMVKPFDETLPDYESSLKIAIQILKEELTLDSSLWAARSLKNIETLEVEYFKK